ncbi:MAG: NADH-quinone oxidoreductase subunit I [Candidatus Omnitrophica bacterium]|nr:NADH-quinone oxidoreductase subunit I [Candidatus Omnitrophota bacterium]
MGSTLSEQLLHRIRDAHKRRALTWWERSYLPAVAQGLWLTSKHFWINLFLHLAHRVGLFKDRQAAVTIQYPDQFRQTSPRLRTRHRLTKRADGTPRCVACMMCETVCPARCIYIVAAEHPDPNVEKYPKSFDIDLGLCVYCGYCVEACPEDAIRMDTQRHDIASYSRDGMWLDIKELINPGTRAFNEAPEKFVQLSLEEFRALPPTPEPPPPGTAAIPYGSAVKPSR